MAPPTESPIHMVPPTESPIHMVPPTESPIHMVPPTESPIHMVPPTESPIHMVPPTESPIHMVPPTESPIHMVPPTESTIHMVPPTESPIQTTEDPLINIPVKLEEQEKPVEVQEEPEKEKKGKDKDKDEEEDGPIGIDLASLDKEDIIKIESTMKNDTELDNMIRRFEKMAKTGQKPFSSTFILPILKKVKYDPRSAPIIVEDQVVNVRMGIHVQSISNFELATMDYDMDMWLRMTWRDPRLAHGYSAPILISEETFLKRFWRPDPFFANSRDALFHRVTFLNFYMYIFPGGEMFFEARLYLKPKCQLVLCNYPHDSQICELKISSMAFTSNAVQFQWFSKIQDAIRFNQNVQLPDLYITDYGKSECDGTRKSGNFTCIEAQFHMKRNLGFHLAQTYIPTTTCVFFSWISVWMPEEFVKGRVFISLTVFLTLSAESSAAKENLPKVSYVKAIDIWFGFVSIFVFFTMIQALVVIALEQQSKTK
uniref:Uncharacterized protein n=1 Tax=Acrobeloides nanus TaxID=290746 RepID=A0A914EAZ8_9BILA